MAESERDPRIVPWSSPSPPRAAADGGERRLTSRGAISRDRIIDAALWLIAEGGYPALSISAVCKRAQVSAASLYHHFGDKAGLMKAMIEDSLTHAARRFLELVGEGGGPLERLDRYLEAMRVLGKEYRANSIGVVATLSQGAGEAPEIAQAVADARNWAWRFMATEMADAFGFADAKVFAHLQFAFATFMIQVSQAGGDRDELRSLYRSLRRVYVITAAAMQPSLLHDPEFAAAVAAASRPDPASTPLENTDD